MKTQKLFGMEIEQSVESQARDRLEQHITTMKDTIKSLKNAPGRGMTYEAIARAKQTWEQLERRVKELDNPMSLERKTWLDEEVGVIQAEERARENAVFAEFAELHNELTAVDTAKNAAIDNLLANTINYVPGSLTNHELRNIAGRLLAGEGVEVDARGRKFTKVDYAKNGIIRVTLNSDGSAMAIIREASASGDGDGA